MSDHTQPSQQVPAAKPGVITTAEELIALLRSCKPEYGTVGSRDCDVTTKRAQIDEAISRLEKYIAPDAGLAEDAKRYRFLSGKDGNRHEPIENAMLFVAFDANDTHELDAAIDAALASQEPQHG